MTDKQLFKRVIEKAINNDWIPEIAKGRNSHQSWLLADPILDELKIDVIFTNGFAKAFFKEQSFIDAERDVCEGREPTYDDYWKIHQHQMLNEIQEGRNPLKFLEKFL